MFPVLLSFRFPDWLARFGWVEGVLTVLLAGAWLWWRRRRPGFAWRGAAGVLVLYAAARTAVALAGPGYRFELHTYGVLVALGFVMAIVVAARQARREFIDANLVLDLAFWILVAALVGSRLLYILVNLPEYVADPLALLKVWTGGLVFYGGFIGAVAASWYFCQRRGVGFFRIADVVIPSVALGHFFGRLGCFSAGCCHGSGSGSHLFGAIYTAPHTVVARSHLLGVPLHPTPLYDGFGELMIFFLLLLLRRHKRWHGQLLVAWLVAYPLWRFLTEMFRGDVERGMLAWIDLFGDQRPELLSTSQVVSLGLLLLAVVLWRRLRRVGQSASGTDTGIQPAR
ncbi:MAG: prolipoprotein diacylglyceryl transferase [Deltaproteobacteria bacterium]|nr:MAG: prolipoprotein diacylglyceryl transferase [Deltaproteobacteria bacterium]